MKTTANAAAEQSGTMAGQPLGRATRVQMLNDAIVSFTSTAQELQHSYCQLQEQVRSLNMQLEEKNRELEKNLQEKERVKNFLFSILESLPTGVVVVDLTGKLLMFNGAVEKITGICPSGLDRQQYDNFIDTLMNNGNSASVHMIVQDVEFVKNCNDVRSLKVVRSPVIGTHGETIGVVFIVQDQTRLRKLETQAERDKRLKGMGEIAIKVAHEVRNPLGSIELFASILRSELGPQPDLQTLAEHISTEVKRLDNSISNLLLFTRQQRPVLHEVNLTSFFGEFVEFIRPIVQKNGLEIQFVSPSEGVSIAADKDLLKQVFLNLTLNSLQAMPEGGSIKITVQRNADDDVSENRWVEISFQDDGIGIAPETVNRIFNPFFTTKESGTGLGLAIVHNIIESHEGTIGVVSRPESGTSFLISLPFWIKEHQDSGD